MGVTIRDTVQAAAAAGLPLPKPGKTGALPALLVLLLFFIILLVLDARLRPVIRDYSYSRAVYLAASTINDAVNEEISNSGVEI